MSDSTTRVKRRRFLEGAGVVAGVAGLGTVAAAGTSRRERWDVETDVLCVGSGAAASSAAIAAVDLGARVTMIEKLPFTGGTTRKSGGAIWVPDNFVMRQKGVPDPKLDCLRYMARYAYPQQYTPESATLGLSERRYRLLEAYYDNAAPMIDSLRSLGVLEFREFRMYQLDTPVPDYADHLPENKVLTGRCMEPSLGTAGLDMGGASMIDQMHAWLAKRQVTVRTDTRATGIIKSKSGRVIGLEADSGGKPLRIRAHRAVVFGTGGYVFNTELVARHQIAIYGSCAAPGSTGDFVSIGSAAGAALGSMHTAWRSQVLVEEALESRAVGAGCHFLPGDSMIVVNKCGHRVMNEKRSYNDRTHVHFVFDPTREEYTNQLLFMVFDERSLDAYGGNYPMPRAPGGSRYLISGGTLEELTHNIAARLSRIAGQTGGVRLDEGFLASLRSSVERFNGYAETGDDAEFQRGKQAYDRVWNRLFSAMRPGSPYPENTKPNPVLHPFAPRGPYHAFILAAGALDTNGGPLINERAQVLALDETPIPGLYGAGNCIASPSSQAYFGGGCTIGMALTYGRIAGLNAAREAAS